MQENLSDTLEKIQQAALEEFSEKGFQGSFPAADREICRSNHRGFLTGYFSSEGGAVCLYRRATCRCLDGEIHGSPDFFCPAA